MPREGGKMAPVEHVVADAGAFLRAAPLQEIGREVYTVREVVAEIRDRETRRRLAALPFPLRFRQPRPEFLRLVTEFARQTGDYASLSATDLQVLALTCQLHAEHGGALPRPPARQVVLRTTDRHPEAPVHLPGFHLPAKTKRPDGEEGPLVTASPEHPGSPGAEDPTFGSFVFWRPPLPSIEEDLRELLEAAGSSTEPEEPKDQESTEEEEEEEGDEGWITPSNVRQIQEAAGQRAEPADVQVGCLTTDFAMQNVLLQMGLHVLAVNGLLIREARSYILRCHGCFRTTHETTRLFCPHCGNKTLKKVAVTVDSEGSLHLHFSRNPKVLNPRGLRYSLPAPQGGKHAKNPLLVADQRFPQQRLSHKARQKTNVFDPDYPASVSPFVENDIYSRASSLQIRDGALGAGRRRMNPNTSTKKLVKKR
ncbi:RNA-binding protein NOB1 isoform X1 [Paroedura picta]|uniref:RNA-binding protein NOB1 isoform X1 n=1 Tax=Paroedura picta TaxID=143630 RepID=UPI004055EDF1